jgi:hypothetical protein
MSSVSVFYSSKINAENICLHKYHGQNGTSRRLYLPVQKNQNLTKILYLNNSQMVVF